MAIEFDPVIIRFNAGFMFLSGSSPSNTLETFVISIPVKVKSQKREPALMARMEATEAL